MIASISFGEIHILKGQLSGMIGTGSKTKAGRIKLVRALSGLSQEKFGIALGTTRGAVGNWELGKGIKQENLEQISENFDVSLDWLSTGKGLPPANLSPATDDPEYEPRAKGGIQEIDARAGLGGGGTVDQNLAWQHGDQVDPIKQETWHFPAPFVRSELRRSEDRIKIIETFGDSMSPTIQSGDRVIIDADHIVPSPDGLYAIRDRYGSIVVKRLQSLRKGDPPVIRIISDNKAHDPEDVSADEIAIIGRVLWGLKRL